MTQSGCTGQDQAFYLSWRHLPKKFPGKFYTPLYVEFTGFAKERQKAGRTTPEWGVRRTLLKASAARYADEKII
jgi:hypothetical protein